MKSNKQPTIAASLWWVRWGLPSRLPSRALEFYRVLMVILGLSMWSLTQWQAQKYSELPQQGSWVAWYQSSIQVFAQARQAWVPYLRYLTDSPKVSHLKVKSTESQTPCPLIPSEAYTIWTSIVLCNSICIPNWTQALLSSMDEQLSRLWAAPWGNTLDIVRCWWMYREWC